ncbi:MAG TPA: 5-formyltetrahydrofolate cyclo-ligase [Planctomycetota bacterium]|nr:5-formyltetrahydrofolate cyclo-ligase [Planctomycetota bacterium]
MRDEKARIRREVAAAFAALSAGELERRGAAVRERLALLPEFRAARSFLLYAPLPDEIDVNPLTDRLLAAGRPVFMPVCREKPRGLDVVPLRDRGADLAPGAMGILEPRPGLAPVSAEDVELVLVPGRAFDRRGRRVGRGAGYYDRFLAGLGARALRVAVALDFQIRPAVPSADYDQPVDLVVTEGEVIRAGAGGS